VNIQERVKIDSSLLSEEERNEGFSIVTDASDNVTLLKQGNQIAWFSRKADKETVQSLIKLITKY